MGTRYTLTVENQSRLAGSLCLYQTMPDQDDDIFSLAWFTKVANPNTKARFEWEPDYCASWSETGNLQLGVMFEACENRALDPSEPGNNSCVLTMKNGAYTFIKADRSAAKGTIGIFCDDAIPNKKASVGIGIGGKTAFATQALMNTDFTFIPKVKYWLGFGKYEEGQVLDLNRLNHVAEVVFPKNVFKLQATLDDNNEWKIG